MLEKYIERFKNNRFIKSVMTLSVGAVISQAINFVGMPFIGRLYTPEVMGDYSLVVGNSDTILSVACLGMLTVFMLPKEDEEARGLSRLVMTMSVVISGFIIAVLWTLRDAYKLFSPEQLSYESSLLILWLFITLNILSNICYAYLNRQKKYKQMLVSSILSSSINVGLTIILGLLKMGFIGYLMGNLSALLVSIIYCCAYGNPFLHVSRSRYPMFGLLKEYKRFPLYQMPANFIDKLGNLIPLKLIEYFYTAAQLGLYSMSVKILSLPITLLAVPVNRVYFQEANERYNRGENIGDFTLKLLEANIKIAILPIVLLMVFGRWIFTIFLGAQWTESGRYASLLGMYYLVMFVANCTSGNFVIIKKNIWNLYSAIVTVLLNAGILVLLLLVPNMSIEVFLLIFSSVMTFKTLFIQGVFFQYLHCDMKRYILFIIKYIVFPTVVSYFITMFI